MINCREKAAAKSAEKATVQGMLHVLTANDQVKVIMLVIPAILSALCCVFHKGGYKLTGKFCERMIREPRARKEP